MLGSRPRAGVSKTARSLRRKLMREGTCPAAVTQGVNLHPDSVLQFAQLQRARAAWHPKVPMVAAGATGQLALASNDQTAPAALIEDLLRGELDIEFNHCELLKELAEPRGQVLARADHRLTVFLAKERLDVTLKTGWFIVTRQANGRILLFLECNNSGALTQI